MLREIYGNRYWWILNDIYGYWLKLILGYWLLKYTS